MDSKLLLQLYGKTDWSPILARKFTNGAVTWYPKADEGQVPSACLIGQTIGVWGGAVQSYDVGFNHQPCELIFVGLDIDHKKGDNAHIAAGELAGLVAAALPEALIRTSTGGLGVHVFIVLEQPIRCGNKLSAQRIAEQLADPYVRRLKTRGIEADIVARNMLWVTGGKQKTVQVGWPVIIEPDELKTEAMKWETEVCCDPGDMGSPVVMACTIGPRSREVLAALHNAGLINLTGDPKSRYLLHIKPVQQALRALPWLAPTLRVESAGTNLNQPNCSLTLKDGAMKLYCFTTGEYLFSIPLGV